MGQLEWLSYGSGYVHGVLLNQTPLIHLERDSLHREVGRTLHVLVDQEGAQENLQHIKHPTIELTRELDPLGRLLQQRWQGLAVGLKNNAASTAMLQPLVGGMPGHHASLGKLALRRYSYDGLGQLIGLQTPGDATLYQYDAQQRLIGMTHADPKGESCQRWRLDAAGNRLPEPKNQGQPGQKTDWSQQVQQNLTNPEFDLLKPDGSNHNNIGEVQRWKTNRVEFSTDQEGRTTHYRYDAHGNRVQATNHDGSKMLLHYDALHQLIGVEQFSADGQLQSTTTYRYDAFGRRLAKTYRNINQETPQALYFGWDGDRLVHTEDATLIHRTVYEPGSFVPLLQLQQHKGHKYAAELLMSEIQDDEEQDDIRFENMPREQRDLLQGALQVAMQPGVKGIQGLPVSEEAAELLIESLTTLEAAHDASAKAHPVTIRHYLTDHLGTPIALVDANGNQAGQVTWAASYNAWGDIQQEYNPYSLRQPLRLQGQQVDMESGLHYNRFRYYDPNIGQYVSQDPIGLRGGANVYSYPRDPLSWVDPLGLQKWSIGTGIESNNPSAYNNGVLDPNVDTGHIFAYVKNPLGDIECIYSVGPAKKMTTSEVKNDFRSKGVPGQTSWPVSEPSKVWEMNFKDQESYDKCAALCKKLKKEPHTYSPTQQCTSEAIKMAKACGMSVPDGEGQSKVTTAGGLITVDDRVVANPYKLNEQMTQSSGPGVSVPPGFFKP